MPPEQANRQTLSRASDWYSVGVILYLCLTRSLPDRGKMPPPRPDGPADLSALCMRLLSEANPIGFYFD